MAQYRKEAIDLAIRAAALRVFARDGYASAGVADIAREAGVSVGNVYRYFAGKEALFDAVIDEDFVRALTRLLRQRVDAVDGNGARLSLPMAAAYPLASEPLVRFCVERRLEVVILLGRAGGSRHEGFASELLDELVRRAIAHFRAQRPSTSVDHGLRFALDHVHRAFLRGMVGALSSFDDEATIRAALDGCARYHLAGVHALMA
jgi:AcrR family transcriptional regulator